VNVTAGLDLSIGEFEEIGNIVKEYASEDATVVVGTVIDPEMTNQIRVTVVATGLGSAAAAALQAARVEFPRSTAAGRAALPAREDTGAREAGSGRGEPSGARAPKPSRGPVDYSNLDRPTIVRQRAVGDGIRAEPEAEELLDIPAFLRRQAD
jgi:cell division protein FtsZ